MSDGISYTNASGVATLIQTAEWLVPSDELPCHVIFAALHTEDNRENTKSLFQESEFTSLLL